MRDTLQLPVWVWLLCALLAVAFTAWGIWYVKYSYENKNAEGYVRMGRRGMHYWHQSLMCPLIGGGLTGYFLWRAYREYQEG